MPWPTLCGPGPPLGIHIDNHLNGKRYYRPFGKDNDPTTDRALARKQHQHFKAYHCKNHFDRSWDWSRRRPVADPGGGEWRKHALRVKGYCGKWMRSCFSTPTFAHNAASTVATTATDTTNATNTITATTATTISFQKRILLLAIILTILLVHGPHQAAAEKSKHCKFY